MMVLINLISNAVNPSLGSRVAKKAMEYIISHSSTIKTSDHLSQVTMKAAEVCFGDVVKFSRDYSENYDLISQKMIINAIKLQHIRVRIKLNILRQIQNVLGNPEREQLWISNATKE